MKRLYIVRHTEKDSKSSNEDFFVKLTEKGLDDAQKLAKKLKVRGVEPQLIVSSPALRARKVAKIISKTVPYEKKAVVYNEVLYHQSVDELIEAINFTFHTVEELIIVGHNPLLSSLAYHFTGYRDQMAMGMALCIEFDSASWVDITPQNANLVAIIKPD